MQRLAAVAALACALRADAGPVPNIDFEFTAAPLGDLLHILADVGHVDIVLVGDGPRIDAHYRRVPWDRALDDLVARAKLARLRDGRVIVVADPAAVTARRKVPRPAYRRAPIDVDFAGADATAAARLVATATGFAYELAGGVRDARLRLHRVPWDQAFDVIAWQTGATPIDKPQPPPAMPVTGCVAPNRSASELRLVGIARRKERAWALFVDRGGQPYVVTKKTCVGKEATMIEDVSASGYAYVKLDGDRTIELHPLSASP